MLLFLNPTIKTQWKVWLFVQTFHCVFQHIHRRSSSCSALWIYTILKLFCSRDQCGLVSLPYGFTLFSNTCSNRCGQCRFYYLMNLHYSQTDGNTPYHATPFYYLMNLHYSQTHWELTKTPAWFYYLMNLHYSQTRNAAIVKNTMFYYLMNLHYSQTG